MNIFSLPESL